MALSPSGNRDKGLDAVCGLRPRQVPLHKIGKSTGLVTGEKPQKSEGQARKFVLVVRVIGFRRFVVLRQKEGGTAMSAPLPSETVSSFGFGPYFEARAVRNARRFTTPMLFRHSPAGTVRTVGRWVPTIQRSGPGALPRISMIIPTRNESGNIRALLARLAELPADLVQEVVFVDDSDDDTPGAIVVFGRLCAFPVVLVHRRAGHRQEGLSGAVLEGFRVANGEWLCVMDGDLQHPPEVIEDLRRVALRDDADLVCASRYADGGDGEALGRLRGLVSRGSTWAARGLFPLRLRGVSDPMSGFFMVRREALDLSRFRPTGFKILLEILVRVPGLHRSEVTYRFATRHAEESKASWREGARYLRHLGRLRFGLREPSVRLASLTSAVRFSLVGGSGVVLNSVLLWLLVAQAGLGFLAGSVLATQASIASNFALTERWVFPGARRHAARQRFVRFLALSNLVHALGLPVLALFVSGLGLHYLVGNILTLGVLFACRFVVSRRLVWTDAAEPAQSMGASGEQTNGATAPHGAPSVLDVPNEAELHELMEAYPVFETRASP